MPTHNLTLNNAQARQLWLHLQALLAAPVIGMANKQHIVSTVRQLGMVQLDSIPNIVRAHHHILWSRHTGYEEHHYNELLGHQAEVFEHFSHDAAILPLEIYPYWQRQRQLRSERFTRGALGEQLPGRNVRNQLLKQIRNFGPQCSRDFANTYTAPADKSKHAWMRPPHKQALDYLWLKGDLCVSHRKGFIKYYDLSERIIPAKLRQVKIATKAQIDFLCSSAIERLGFATPNNIQAFYDACSLDEVKLWIKRHPNKHRTINVETYAGKSIELLARADIEQVLHNLPKASARLRIVNPFDPVVRDRKKLQWLFGMDYTIEIYVPAAKRKYGYYVYPLLENASMVARLDVCANRQQDCLEVNNWWLEDGIKHSAARTKRLKSELQRLATLAGINNVSAIPTPISK